MPENNIPLASEEDIGELPFLTSDGINEQLRQPVETRDLSMELADDELWSRDEFNDNDSSETSSEYSSDDTSEDSSESSSVDSSGEESSERSDMEFDPTPMERRQTNAAQNRGRNVARRGRNRGHIGNENRNATPFERRVTFNGFARNMEPEEVVGYTVEVNGTMLYQVKWRNDENRIRLIESSVMRSYRPLMIVDFFESMMLNKNQQN